MEPKKLNNKKCSKKFVVTLAVENGKASLLVENLLTVSIIWLFRMLLVQYMHVSGMLMMKVEEDQTVFS